MIALVQRVIEASVIVESEVVGEIKSGLLVLLGIKNEDTMEEASYLATKVINCRIFNDENGKMNLSLLDSEGDMLVVSQFTLHADTRHGNRPSFTDAAKPIDAERLYRYFINECKSLMGHHRVMEGKFGAMMKIKLINDGPVTITIKSKNEN